MKVTFFGKKTAKIECSSALDAGFLCKSKCNTQFHNITKKIRITESGYFFSSVGFKITSSAGIYFKPSSLGSLRPRSCLAASNEHFPPKLSRERLFM